MNIQLIAEQIGRIHLTLETQDAFEVYGGTWLGAFEVTQTGTAQWTLTVREKEVAAAPLRDYKIYARQIATGREWEVLSGKILVAARTAAVPADKLAPVEYFVTVPVVDHDVDAVGSTIVQGIPGPQGPKGDPGPPGEGGMTSEERATLGGAAQRGGDNTFTASNTFTGEVDMSGASVTPPEGWNVGELTAEQVKEVVPMAWGAWTSPPSAAGSGSVAIGEGAKADFSKNIAIGVKAGSNGTFSANGIYIGEEARGYGNHNLSLGYRAEAASSYSIAVGCLAASKGKMAVAIANSASAEDINAIGVGYYAKALKANSLTIGAMFNETTDSGNVTHTCTTEGTGSITIGAGANTLNNGDTESSNSVTIGCKAENKGADSVVIGAQASGTAAGTVALGASARARGESDIAIGNVSSCAGSNGVALGFDARVEAHAGMALGRKTRVKAQEGIAIGTDAIVTRHWSMAIGHTANVADQGVIALASRSALGDNKKTQIYIACAGTELANEYYNGEAFMGYTVTNVFTGTVLACGTRRLSELFPDNSLTQPASLDENGEWVMPKVFHPSDLDMPQEEPSEPEEYTPLPVLPIVEPEDLPPHAEIENS